MTLAGRSAKHVRNVGATLHSVLQIAANRGAIDRNPVDMADLPKVSNDPTLYYLTPGRTRPGARRRARRERPPTRARLLADRPPDHPRRPP